MRIGRAWFHSALCTVLIAFLLGDDLAAYSQPDPRAALVFGIVNAYDDPAAAAELGISWEQITFDWAAFQPSGPGDFVTRSVKASWLDNARHEGREVVGLIIGTPPWASLSGEWSAVPLGLGRAADDPDNAWAAFVTRLAAYYAPRGVHHWIISEEPNIRPGEGRVRFAGSVEAYAQLLQTAYLSAYAADPAAQILIAGMNDWTDTAAGREPYLARLLVALEADIGAAAHSYYFDAVVVRAFNRTRALWDSVTQARVILRNANMAAKPIWLVTNASPTLDPVPGTAAEDLFGITPEQQADLIVHAAAIGFALGIERLAIDRLVDAPHPARGGLVRADGSRRPAFAAFQDVIRWGAGTHAVQWVTSPAVNVVILEQDTRDVFVLWANRAAPASFWITSDAAGETGTLTGPYDPPGLVVSNASPYPAAFAVTTPGAWLDSNGFLAVAGSPRLLILNRTDFFRVVYLDTDTGRIRLK